MAAAIKQQAPTDDFSGKWFVVSVNVGFNAITIPGLEAAEEYVVGYFLKWTKPDGSTPVWVSVGRRHPS